MKQADGEPTRRALLTASVFFLVGSTWLMLTLIDRTGSGCLVQLFFMFSGCFFVCLLKG